MTAPADGDRPTRGKRPPRGKAKPGGGRPPRGGGQTGGKPAGAIDGLSPEAFAKALVQRMEACPDAERLNDRVLQPFIAALESVCKARGYVLNIYGESANLVFTGDEEDAETIYQLVEAYLDGGSEDVD